MADSDSCSWLRSKLFEKAAIRGVDELERKVFRMAAGGEDGCRLVRDQRFIKELVDTMGSWIKAQDLAVPGLIDIAEKARRRSDSRWASWTTSEKWPLENTPWEPALAWVPNYGST